MIVRTKRNQGRVVLPLWITLVILLLNNLPVARSADPKRDYFGVAKDLATAVTQGSFNQHIEGDELPEAWAAAKADGLGYEEGPGLVFERRLEETVQYGFNLTTAFIFPADFEFDTAAIINQLRGTVRLTQLFYRRIMATDWPEAYHMVDSTFDSADAGGNVNTGFTFIVIFVLTTFTFRMVGDIPTAQNTFNSALANNELFLDGAGVDVFDTSPNGWNPVDYANLIRTRTESAIFQGILEASVIEIQQLPTGSPSETPSMLPSVRPTGMPSAQPSRLPTASPSMNPSPSVPTISESPTVSEEPSNMPVPSPSSSPSDRPSTSPSARPSRLPTRMPSVSPTNVPSNSPSDADFAFTATNQNVMNDADFAVISSAFAQLNDIMVGDLTNQATSGTIRTFNPNAPECAIPTTVDDLHICISYNVDLLESNILARAGVLLVRGTTDTNPNLPIVSAMDMRPDLGSNPNEFRVIVRQQALFNMGIGVLWPTFGLIQNDNTENCRYNPNTNAAAAFRVITGCPATFSIPLDPVICSHWEQECFGGREIMNPEFIDDPLPVLSTVTVGSLEDLGYRVNYGGADVLTEEDFSSECRCSRRSLTAEQSFQRVPPISPEALAEATASGKQYLADMRSFVEVSESYEAPESNQANIGVEALLGGADESRTSEGPQFVGHKAIAVFVRDGIYIREVIVRE